MECTGRRSKTIPPASSTSAFFSSRAVTNVHVEEPPEHEREVVALFDRFRDSVARYVLSFGISIQDAEEVTQDVFLALFRHLRLGRSRRNLQGWIFRVAHNLSLKRRAAIRRANRTLVRDWIAAQRKPDESLNPERLLSISEKQQRLLAVFQLLSEEDQQCLRLRAEGIRYREIAEILNMSLGAVSISLTRSITRLIRVDRM